MISYGKQHIDSSDIKAVTKVLKSDFITQGDNVKKFENILSKTFGSKYSCVVSSGTAALHLLGLALNWKKGEVILTTPISFLATSNSILYTGATPVFIDINEDDYNIDINLLLKKIIYLKKAKKKISAIICTDFAGHPCDWKQLRKIASKYKITLINDCCHAFGASIKNNKKYAIKYADFVTLSFHAVKHITTGEGGAILSNNKKIIDEINVLKTHGVIRKKKQKKFWEYQMVKLGYNYRITDFQCALGISQIKKLGKYVKRRKEIADLYNKSFAKISNIIIPKVKKTIGHAYHLYPLKINFKKFGILKEKFFNQLRKKNINLQVHYMPIYNQPFYKKKFNFNKKNFLVAENFYEQEASLPIYYSLKKSEQLKVIISIKKILKVK